MDKKWMILTCFFSVMTLISSIICSCLVFFNENARTDNNSNKVIANNYIYKSTLITYNQNNNINLINISPNYSLERSFSITNNNSDIIKYDIVWENVMSTWNSSSNSKDLVYSISCTNGEKIDNKEMPTNNNNLTILEELELKTNKSNDCTINIKYINTDSNQSNNINSFNGTYKVIIKE